MSHERNRKDQKKIQHVIKISQQYKKLAIYNVNLIAKIIIIRTSSECLVCMVNSLCYLCTPVLYYQLVCTLMLPAISRSSMFLTAAKPRKVNTEKIQLRRPERTVIFVMIRLLKVPLNYKRQPRKARLLPWFRSPPHH